MKKITFILLVVAGSINIGLALNGSPWNYLPAVLFLFAAFATFKSSK